MNFEKIKSESIKFIHFVEFILAIFIVTSVILGLGDLVKYFRLIVITNPIDTYAIFQKFLGHVLLMAVGLELVVMLVYHSPTSVIEVLLYAIARKLLIGNEGMTDYIIGIVAIAAIFAIRKYLFVEDLYNGKKDAHYFLASALVKSVNEQLSINIPEELGNTIGGVVSKLAQSTNMQLREGSEVRISNIKIRITKINGGLIEKVSVSIDEC